MSLYPDSKDDDEGEDTERRPEAANERAMELFLESGLLTPLEKLSNVRSFEFEFTALDFDCEIYKPTFKHEMLNDLKQKVERNYTMRDNGVSNFVAVMLPWRKALRVSCLSVSWHYFGRAPIEQLSCVCELSINICGSWQCMIK